MPLPSRPPAQSAQRLNDAQRQRVCSTLAHVNDLLESALRGLDADAGQSPFNRQVADATPLQRKVIADYAARARELMLAALARLGIALPRPQVGAVWAAQVALRSAQIAAFELETADLRGYGPLPEEAARELSAAVGPLLSILEQMESFLAQGAGAELESRLRRLDATPDALRLLAETGRMVQAYGLVEFRGTLDSVIERAEARELEIALFGRASTGKSSLLNCILGENVLPVGTSPVTAVPIRIVHGLRREGRVWFADAVPQVFSLDRLAEFANESQNPANARHVTRLQLELPVPILERGVRFIDSPGFGALSSASMDTALAYLPRCDLGILAIDAASPPGAEEASVVDRLLRSGAAVMVVLTKADALADGDALHALIHARRQLAAATGSEVAVHLVSVKGVAAEYCRRWQHSALAASIEDGLAQRQRSLRRKVATLAQEVAAALERRLSGHDATEDPGEWPRAESVLRDALDELERARAMRAPLVPQPERAAEDSHDEAAYNAAIFLQRDPVLPNDLTPIVVAAARGRERAAAEAAIREVGRLRAVLGNALAEAGAAAAQTDTGAEELPRPAGLPLADAAALIPRLLLARKPLLSGVRFVSERLLRLRLRRAGMAVHVAAALTQYEQRLSEWRGEQLESLRRAFIARADRLRGPHLAGEAARGAAVRSALREDLARLKRLLGDEQGQSMESVKTIAQPRN